MIQKKWKTAVYEHGGKHYIKDETHEELDRIRKDVKLRDLKTREEARSEGTEVREEVPTLSTIYGK